MLYSLFYIYREFQVLHEKITPTQSANSYQKSQFELGPFYISLLKNGSTFPSPSSPRGDANYEILLQISIYIFNFNKTVETMILKYL